MPYTHIGTPTRTRWSWVRHDTWHTGEVDRVWCASEGDQSPLVLSVDYDVLCAHCWLNHGHSRELHDSLVASNSVSGRQK